MTFSSLFIGIHSATESKHGCVLRCVLFFQFPFHRDSLCNVCSHEEAEGLQVFQFPFHRDSLCNLSSPGTIISIISAFSSLFIGIHSATYRNRKYRNQWKHLLSVPFSSGFTLQRRLAYCLKRNMGILSVPFSSGFTLQPSAHQATADAVKVFQFPFHRDSLCNVKQRFGRVLVQPFFQFPFHRDSLCNRSSSSNSSSNRALSVPFSSGFTLQRALWQRPGVSNATLSVPFSSGFTLQHKVYLPSENNYRLSVPFSSGFTLQPPSIPSNMSSGTPGFQFPFHRDSLCNQYF